MQGGMLMPQAANGLLTAFPDEMFENIADLERSNRVNPPNFWIDGGGVNTQVSLDALMAGMLGGEGDVGAVDANATVSKYDKDKSVSNAILDELPPIDVVAFRDNWEWLCMSGTMVNMSLLPNLGEQVAGLGADLYNLFANFDIYDVDGDGTPNDSDIAPFDGTNNGILVTGSTSVRPLGGGLSARAWGDGVFELFRNGDSLGNFRVTSVTSSANGSATTGTSTSAGVNGPVPSVSADGSFTYTSESGAVYTYTPFTGN